MDVAGRLANCANCSLGVRISARKAELLHLLNIQMVESSIPAFTAAVAAPILKLYPAKFWYGKLRLMQW